MDKQKFINQIEPWYGDEERTAMQEYLSSGSWIMEFKKTREFERMISEYTKAKYCSVVNNGTVSIFVALKALGIGAGDEVIVPDYTMIATPNAVLLTGATPVFVDIDPKTMCVDTNLVEGAITKKTKAILHVSVNGRAGELNRLKGICDKKGIMLLEDAAQSFGSFYKGRHLGTIGLIGSFSFSVPKIITTGQGGAIVTDEEEIYKKICKIKDFGRISGGADIHDEIGWNFKFTDLQAVFGIEQMKKLPHRIERKRHIWRVYRKLLKDVKGMEFLEADLNEFTPWFMEVFVDDPGKIRDYLKQRGIGTRLIYPPVHSQKIFNHIKGSFKNTDLMCQKGLWLPSSAFLKDEDIRGICAEIKKYFKS